MRLTNRQKLSACVRPALVLAAIASAAAVLMVTFSAAVRPNAGPGDTSGLKLFMKLMPVFEHPRCANCHGRVNPINGDYHGGGPVTVESPSDIHPCVQCHTVGTGWEGSPELNWRVSPEKTNFYGKSVIGVCEQVSKWAHERGTGKNDLKPEPKVRQHIRNDKRIGWAFLGKAGGASETADPPPISQSEFSSRITEWARAGATCDGDGWWGTVTFDYTESRREETKPNDNTTRNEQEATEKHGIIELMGTMVHITQSQKTSGTVALTSTQKGGECGAVTTTAGAKWTVTGSLDVTEPFGERVNFSADPNMKKVEQGQATEFLVSVFTPSGKLKRIVHDFSSTTGGCGAPVVHDTTYTSPNREEFSAGHIVLEPVHRDPEHPQLVDGSVEKMECPEPWTCKLIVKFKVEKR